MYYLGYHTFYCYEDVRDAIPWSIAPRSVLSIGIKLKAHEVSCGNNVIHWTYHLHICVEIDSAKLM